MRIDFVLFYLYYLSLFMFVRLNMSHTRKQLSDGSSKRAINISQSRLAKEESSIASTSLPSSYDPVVLTSRTLREYQKSLQDSVEAVLSRCEQAPSAHQEFCRQALARATERTIRQHTVTHTDSQFSPPSGSSIGLGHINDTSDASTLSMSAAATPSQSSPRFYRAVSHTSRPQRSSSTPPTLPTPDLNDPHHVRSAFVPFKANK